MKTSHAWSRTRALRFAPTMLLLAALASVGGAPAAAADGDAVEAPATFAAPQVDTTTAGRVPNKVVPGSELENMSGPLLRMVLSLLAVLVVLGVCAWLARRVRGAQIQGGLIQIVSGLSLGPKEKVVLLRVGEDQVLVGLSAAGMQPLHVIGKAAATQPQPFSLGMAEAAGLDALKEQAS